MKNINGEIIVIDNNSSDGSFDFFQNRFPQVKFIWNKNKFRFCKGKQPGTGNSKRRICFISKSRHYNS